MADGIPFGVSSEAARIARDTLGGAVEVAGQLPARLGAPLLETARDAFAHGMHLTAVISSVGTLVLAILVATLLRRAQLGAEPESDSNDADAAAQVEVATGH